MGTTDTMTPEPPPEDTSGKEPFFKWYKRKPIAWVGTGLTGAGIIVGAVGTGMAAGASATYDKHAEEVRAYGDSQMTPGPWCGSETDPGQDLPGYEDACNTLRSDRSKINTNTAIGITGWVFAGVGALGTAAYVIVDWYLPNSKKKSGDAQGTAVMVAPIVTPTYKGLGVAGVF
jgi:hypothetical protein